MMCASVPASAASVPQGRVAEMGAPLGEISGARTLESAFTLRHGYSSPSSPFRDRPSDFLLRKFWLVSVSAVEPHIRGGRRKWFDVKRAEKRTFEVYYGFNPRCCHKGTWGKPGTFHWRRYRET